MADNNTMQDIARGVVENAINSKANFSVAESCTGGLISKLITEIPGSSNCFSHGLVTYSDDAKTKLLGINTEDLLRFGAVSEFTAKKMAERVAKINNSDFSLAVTGIAGPTGGTVEKSVGTVWIAWGVKIQDKFSFTEISWLECDYVNYISATSNLDSLAYADSEKIQELLLRSATAIMVSQEGT